MRTAGNTVSGIFKSDTLLSNILIKTDMLKVNCLKKFKNSEITTQKTGRRMASGLHFLVRHLLLNQF